MRDLILDFKFKSRLDLSRLLGGLLIQAVTRAGLGSPDLVLPVPLHSGRLAWRGYNQALELARPVAGFLGGRLDQGALVRIRATAPQMTLDRRERMSNLAGAFAADPDRVGGCSVLLVDDITTTGRSLHECATALRQAGSGTITALVLAKA